MKCEKIWQCTNNISLKACYLNFNYPQSFSVTVQCGYLTLTAGGALSLFPWTSSPETHLKKN